MEKALNRLSVLAGLSAVISACIGVFYTNHGAARTVFNIYGQPVTLYGDGIYANDSLLRAGATKGMDIVMILAGLMLFGVLLLCKKPKARLLLQSGLLMIILYAGACLMMGVSFNRLFLLYTVQFGSSFFAFFLSLHTILHTEIYQKQFYERRWKGTGIFLLAGGCSTLLWLAFILPAVVTGQPLETIEIYTTEPTFAVDLALILPSMVFCGVMILKNKKIGYQTAPVLLTLLAGVGACAIFQTMYQHSLGIVFAPGSLIGMVGSFILLGIIAIALNLRMLRFA